MKKGDLKAQVIKWSHRTDLDDEMDEFIENVSQRLGRRFGVMPARLVADSDTNSLLTTHSRIYMLGCQVEVSIFTHDANAASVYESMFQEEISQMNINYQDLDWAACPPPQMKAVQYD